MTERSLVPATTDVALDEGTRSQLQALTTALPNMGAEDVQRTIIWAEAVGAAAQMRRARALAREASELKIRAERRLGQLLDLQYSKVHGREQWLGRIDARRIAVGLRHEGTYLKLGKMPTRLFDKVVADLLERDMSTDIHTVLRQAHHASLEPVDVGIFVAWDGCYFIAPGAARRPRRSHNTDLAKVRAELHTALRLSKEPPRSPASRELDAAYARARREAQKLSQLRSTIHGEPGRLVGEAESLQGQVAQLLFEAYRSATMAAHDRQQKSTP